MKKSVLIRILVAVTLVFTGAIAHSQTTNRFQVNGAVASASACLNNCLGGNAAVEVASSGNGSNATWFVYFAIYGFDSQGTQTAILSSGQIPNSMISGNGQTSLTLNLDTNAAGLGVQYCNVDSFADFYNCAPYAGVMNITWTPTKTFTTSGTVQDKQTSSGFTLQFHITGDDSSAVVQANIFGQQYTDSGQSQIGTEHVGQISFTQLQ
jgi:hypothetical protein